MIRIRFHGRGGHGVKTASCILGTAAFLAGYQIQDSPVYGAERRGAAVVAFTRRFRHLFWPTRQEETLLEIQNHVDRYWEIVQLEQSVVGHQQAAIASSG